MRARAGQATSTALLVVAALLLAGCSTPSGHREVAAFHAHVTYASGGSHDYKYETVAQVWDIDGEWRPAHDLLQIPPSPRLDLAHYLLDQNNRVVAIVGECATGDGTQCEEYTAVNWYARGMLAPIGFGLLSQPGHDIESWGGRHVSSAHASIVKKGSETFVTANNWSQLAVGPYPYPDGPFIFHAGQELPVSAQWSVSDYATTGPALPEVPALPLPGPFPAAGTRSEFFPGAGEKMFGSNYTFQDYIDAARSQASQSGAPIPAGSCGVSFIWGPAPLTTGGALDVLPTKFGPRVDMAWKTPAGDLRTFHVESSQDFLGKKSFQVSPSNAPVRPVTCDELRRSPAPQGSPNDFLQRAQASPARGHLERFTWSGGFAANNSPRPPEAGWDTYEFYMEPPSCGAGCLLYSASYEPASGQLELILGRPAELFHAG